MAILFIAFKKWLAQNTKRQLKIARTFILHVHYVLPKGTIAQLVERFVYTENVGGSSPSSLKNHKKYSKNLQNSIKIAINRIKVYAVGKLNWNLVRA